jgi:hypothetical protein
MLAGLSAVAVDSFFSFAVERIEHSVYVLLMVVSYRSLCAGSSRPQFKMQPIKDHATAGYAFDTL